MNLIDLTDDLCFKIFMTHPDLRGFLIYILKNFYPELGGFFSINVESDEFSASIDDGLKKVQEDFAKTEKEILEFEAEQESPKTREKADSSSIIMAPTELIPLSPFDKAMIVDVNATLSTNDKVAFEMQARSMHEDNLNNQHINMRTRNVFLVSKLFSADNVDKNAYNRGLSPSHLPKVFLLNFCNFTIRDDLPNEFIHHVRYRYASDNTIYSDKTTISLIELNKMHILLNKTIDEITPIEAICLFFKYCGDGERIGLINNLVEKYKDFDAPKKVYDEINKSHGVKIMKISEELHLRDRMHVTGVITTLETKVNNLDHKKADLEHKKADLEQKKADLEQKKADLEQIKTDLEQKKADLEHKKADLEQELEIERAKKNAFKDQLQNIARSMLLKNSDISEIMEHTNLSEAEILSIKAGLEKN